MARRPSYTDYPRTILWLVPGGTLTVNGSTVEVAPFYLSKWPITNAQYAAFDPEHRPAAVSPGPRDIAVGVGWEQADAYCRWYAEVSRKPMRLPTEAEWLHACRGGSDDPATDPTEGEGSTLHGIGGLDPRLPADFGRINGFGLHGMLGGVWEWTANPAAGAGSTSELRVLHGGSFRTDPGALRCGLRREVPKEHLAEVGFRVAKSLR